MAKQKLLSAHNVEWRFKNAKSLLNKYGWQIKEEVFPFFIATKKNYASIPGEVIIFFDANTCVLSSSLYHEQYKKFTTLFRQILTTNGLKEAMGYPRSHIGILKAKRIHCYYLHEMPQIENITKQYLKLINKGRIKSIEK